MRLPPKGLWPQYHQSPGPMPEVAKAQVYLPDAEAALQRAAAAWNPTQMRDALRSLRMFVDRAEEVLEVLGGDQRPDREGE